MAELTPSEAAILLSEVKRETYRYLGTLQGGESGAHRFLSPSGDSVVIKWDSTVRGIEQRLRGVEISERLRRDASWPVPREEIVRSDETLFVIQEFMAGAPPRSLDHGVVDELLDLHVRRLDRADASESTPWAHHLIETLTVGGTGYCLHSSLLQHDERTRALMGRIELFGVTLNAEEFRGRDLIHWDLHPGNLLVTGDTLSAVIDTDFAQIGDARFDVAFLALTSWSVECSSTVRSRLFSAIGPIDEMTTQAYFAHCLLRLIDWPIRRGRFDEVTFWLDKAAELLTI